MQMNGGLDMPTDTQLVPMERDSTLLECKGGKKRDDPIPLSSLPPSLSMAGFPSDWVLQNVKEIQFYVGVSC